MANPVVELDEEIDGDEIGSRNYRLAKIGESVSINSEFDPQCLPSQPLAVSERLRLLFVAYPQGFYVARTNLQPLRRLKRNKRDHLYRS